MRAKLDNSNDCAVPLLSRATARLVLVLLYKLRGIVSVRNRDRKTSRSFFFVANIWGVIRYS